MHRHLKTYLSLFIAILLKGRALVHEISSGSEDHDWDSSFRHGTLYYAHISTEQIFGHYLNYGGCHFRSCAPGVETTRAFSRYIKIPVLMLPQVSNYGDIFAYEYGPNYWNQPTMITTTSWFRPRAPPVLLLLKIRVFVGAVYARQEIYISTILRDYLPICSAEVHFSCSSRLNGSNFGSF